MSWNDNANHRAISLRRELVGIAAELRSVIAKLEASAHPAERARLLQRMRILNDRKRALERVFGYDRRSKRGRNESPPTSHYRPKR